MKKWSSFLAVLLCMILFSSCVHQQPQIEPLLEGRKFGFWGGLWHGMIATIMFVVHWFDNSVLVYAPNNNGGWYMFGFLVGVGGFAGSIKVTTSNKKR